MSTELKTVTMDAMVLSPDLESRMRLRQAMSFVPEFGFVRVMSTLSEGLQRLFAGESFGSFFIATLFGHEVARDFIEKSKGTKGGRDAAYIFTFSGEAKSAELAQDLIHGADGFLVEPFSVESLQKIYRLAVEVKKQRVIDRQKSGMRLIVQDTIEAIDEWAFESYETEYKSLPSRLQKLRQTIHSFPEDSHDTYFEILEELFLQIQHPKIITYRGPSRRLRKKFNEIRKEGSSHPLWRVLTKN